jgi:hypothetical protein
MNMFARLNPMQMPFFFIKIVCMHFYGGQPSTIITRNQEFHGKSWKDLNK